MKKCVLSIIALLTVNTAAIAQSVKCPDNRHPHMVDLVLPSGTKWACCNLGAGNPNQLGSKYRWGETHAAQNNEDDLEKYKFYDSKNNKYANIGENISGTKYDAAHVKTAGKWRMPTKRETKELITNCKREIKVLSNNKMVYVFYGKNGKAIFIPILPDVLVDEVVVSPFVHPEASKKIVSFLKCCYNLKNVSPSKINIKQ